MITRTATAGGDGPDYRIYSTKLQTSKDCFTEESVQLFPKKTKKMASQGGL